jgi:acyl-coenzyme A synthetase/AMP-(fatty) acid ligase
VKDPAKGAQEMAEALKEWSMGQILKWESPREIEHREKLPRTLAGKVAFTELFKQ